jgi:hypothetical protein
MLRRLFPDALFIFIYREPRANIASLIESWKAEDHGTYNLNGYRWKYFLPPRWQSMNGWSIPRICAAQWTIGNQVALDDLSRIPQLQWCAVSYDALVSNPGGEVRRLMRFVGLGEDDDCKRVFSEGLPLSGSTRSAPGPHKWRQYEAQIELVIDDCVTVAERLSMLSRI